MNHRISLRESLAGQCLRALLLPARTLVTPGILDRLRTARAPHDVFDILAHQFDQEQDPHSPSAVSL